MCHIIMFHLWKDLNKTACKQCHITFSSEKQFSVYKLIIQREKSERSIYSSADKFTYRLHKFHRICKTLIIFNKITWIVKFACYFYCLE